MHAQAFNLVVGAAAGVINVLATTPLWMVRTPLLWIGGRSAALPWPRRRPRTVRGWLTPLRCPCGQVSTQLMSQSKRKVVGVTPYKGMFDGLAQCVSPRPFSTLQRKPPLGTASYRPLLRNWRSLLLSRRCLPRRC